VTIADERFVLTVWLTVFHSGSLTIREIPSDRFGPDTPHNYT